MKQICAVSMAFLLLGGVLVGGNLKTTRIHSFPAPVASTVSAGTPARPLADACFAPGTSDEYVAEWMNRMGRGSSLDYELANRWTQTATNNTGTGAEGLPITLTYSFVPDGTILDGHPSVLFSRMNTLFATQAIWQAKFTQIFGRWSQVAGLHYVHEAADDGAVWPDSPGALGVRGDLRIGMITIDGVDGVLAYDYYPDFGDMALDSAENWAASTQNYIFMRNIIAHEHGHGFGMAHVCPVNQTKLLEPFYSAQFDGPQHDDIRAANRFYGDRYEPNETAATAVRLGPLARDTVIQNVSIDHVVDVDYYQFGVPAGNGMTILLEPIGKSYLSGPQNPNGTCTTGNTINSLNDLNLDLYLFNGSGAVLRGQSTTNPAGSNERIFHFPVVAAGDSFMAKVVAGGVDSMQLYRLTVSLFNLSDPYLSINPIAFDTALLGIPLTISPYLVNATSGTRNITSIQIAGDFTVTPNLPLSIPAHDSVQFTVTYLADTLGARIDTLRIQHDGPSGVVVCPVSGITVGARLIFVYRDSVNFGDVNLGSMDSVGVPLRNQGNTNLILQSFTAPFPFSMTAALPATMVPGQTLFIYPKFTPTVLGPQQGILVLMHSGLNSPDTLFLSGNGIPTGADELPSGIPSVYRLGGNYPNPFNPVTQISFDLPRTTAIRLQVFDVEGRLVSELENGRLPAGRYTREYDGSQSASGLYFYRLTSPEFAATGKMILLK
jgi:hypothetical protein